jgi:hypothetical protein
LPTGDDGRAQNGQPQDKFRFPHDKNPVPPGSNSILFRVDR